MNIIDDARCPGCYQSFGGWWCDNCDQWPCTCDETPSDGCTELTCPYHGEANRRALKPKAESPYPRPGDDIGRRYRSHAGDQP